MVKRICTMQVFYIVHSVLNKVFILKLI